MWGEPVRDEAKCSKRSARCAYRELPSRTERTNRKKLKLNTESWAGKGWWKIVWEAHSAEQGYTTTEQKKNRAKTQDCA